MSNDFHSIVLSYIRKAIEEKNEHEIIMQTLRFLNVPEKIPYELCVEFDSLLTPGELSRFFHIKDIYHQSYRWVKDLKEEYIAKSKVNSEVTRIKELIKLELPKKFKKIFPKRTLMLEEKPSTILNIQPTDLYFVISRNEEATPVMLAMERNLIEICIDTEISSIYFSAYQNPYSTPPEWRHNFRERLSFTENSIENILDSLLAKWVMFRQKRMYEYMENLQDEIAEASE